MFDKILSFSIAHRALLLLITFALAVVGIYNYRNLSIDAVPDITNTQVQINTDAPGYSPLEIEQRVTYPIETALAGIPKLDYTRSLSRYGLSQVTVVFNDGTDIYFARQLVSERLQGVREILPRGMSPKMGPVATGLGEIVMYILQNSVPHHQQFSSTDLRTLQDWVVRPQLRNIPGVVEVNSIGGHIKQYQVAPLPERMVAFDITFQDIVQSLLRNNQNANAGYIEKNGEQFLIRSEGQVKNIHEIEEISVRAQQGKPILIKDVAQVSLGHELRTGAATKDGSEVVLGTTFMLLGENSREVAHLVSERIKEIQRSLPDGVTLKTVYDRTNLVDATIATVKKNLFEGALLVVGLLFLLLGNFRAAVITACVLPLSMLFTISGMVGSGITGNTMSLGALDFGLIVDGSVILVENCIRRLAEVQQEKGRGLSLTERLSVVFSASSEVRKATLFGELIIMIVYLPILTLSGIEGKMFHPMAYTVLLALLGAMILSITFVPAAVAVFISGKVSERENWVLRFFKQLYEPIIRGALRARVLVVAGSVLLVVVSSLIAQRLGAEFIPSLDEGDIALHALRIPGTSLSQAVKMQHVLEEKLKTIPEVETTFSKIGTDELGSDPVPPSVTDGFVILKPRNQWNDPTLSKAALVRRIAEILGTVPGNNYEFSQPIEMRFNELIAGVRSDVAVKVFGDDMDKLAQTGEEVRAVLASVPGASDVKVEQVTGLPFLSIHVDREMTSRYGISVADVHEFIEGALGGTQAGFVFEGDRRFPLLVRMKDDLRNNSDAFLTLPFPLPSLSQEVIPNSAPTNGTVEKIAPSRFIPLGELAQISFEVGPNQVSRENGKRLIKVTANIRGRDLGSFVEEAKAKISSQVPIAPGYWIEWGGQFEHLLSAQKRLSVVVPLAILLILLMLYATFGNLKDTFTVFSGVPFALTGGIVALWVRDIPFSISAAVGFIALSGVAVLNSLVIVSFIRQLREKGAELYDSIVEGSLIRLRPVLMTALVASLGFVPMAVSTGIGSEVQRPLATVVIGGIISSTLLTLVVLPALYSLLHSRGNKQSS